MYLRKFLAIPPILHEKCVHVPENLWEKLKHKKSNENCERKIVDCFLNNVSSSFCSFCAESFGRTLRVNSKMLYYWKTCKLRDTSMLILSLNLAFALHRMRQFEYSQCHTTSVKGIFLRTLEAKLFDFTIKTTLMLMNDYLFISLFSLSRQFKMPEMAFLAFN